ncbi:unnamed protein product [Clavelina lepadiformis]|uniref:DH domain-containing protein n=2 Tax=Clavelina lepadiformis TaxID=159417 RepID=A0ABP0H603_CLALP
MANCDGIGDLDGVVEEDAFHNDINDNNNEGPSPFRKIRTKSYYRAISTPPKIRIQPSLPSVEEPSEHDVILSLTDKQLLYQKVKEKGILNDVTDDEDVEEDELLPGCCLKRGGTLRQSWIFQPHVQESLIVQNMSSKEKKRQEAMFELITSESSYLRSLNVLVNCFMSSEELRACITSTEYHHLFSNVENVRAASRRFHSALMKRRKSSSIVIDDVSDIVIDQVKSNRFAPYITYCSNETYQQRALQRLMRENETFVDILRKLESSQQCAGLPLHSFLLLPMQRITRLPLLIDTIRQRCDVTMPQYDVASRALRETTNLVKICNERAKSLERTEHMIQLQQQLEFKSSRSFPLVSAQRYLLKSGALIKSSDESVLGFRRVSKQELNLFLFNDVLIITRKKSKDTFSVTDYCYKNRLSAREIIDDVTNSFVLILEKNQEGQRIEMRLEADKPNIKARWMMALQPQVPHKITRETMQVEVIRSLLTDETDMTSLKVMDVYIVIKTTPDGWIFGERLSDGCRAWLPSTHVKEILSERIRQRNLQRRSRLLGEETLI